MTLNFGSKHKVRGRHFKLFSDELPKIDFDKTSLEEYEATATERRQARVRRSGPGSVTDRMSLPPLGTPEWEMTSEGPLIRPSSIQGPFSSLNPDFAKVNRNIQRRHTIRDSTVNGGNHNQRIPYRETFVDVRPRGAVSTEAWVKHASPDHAFEYMSELDKLEGDHLKGKAILAEKPPTPRKRSVFKELLDASHKENLRMTRIREGLKFSESCAKRTQSMRHRRHGRFETAQSSSDKIPEVSYVERHVPDIISDGDKDAPIKPGILKHGARVRDIKVNLRRANAYLRPRLVHQEDLPLLRGGPPQTPGEAGNEVRVSVYSESPLNRVSDMMFVPLPSSKSRNKPKRVNFREAIIKEITEVSESGFLEDSAQNSYEGKSRFKMIETTKGERKIKTLSIKNDAEIMNAFKVDRSHDFPISESKKRSENYLQHDDKQDYIDTILMSTDTKSKPTKTDDGVESSATGAAVEKDRDTHTDEVDIIAVANSPIELNTDRDITDTKPKPRKNHQPPFVAQAHSDQRIISHGSHLTSSEHGSMFSDVDAMSDLTALFDDDSFDINNLPEEIDRSMLGEDLIKAYRLWDRKRKAFPMGLRKIEAPPNRMDPLLAKHYGNVKTYKIPAPHTTPKVDVSKNSVSHTGKTSQKTAIVEWV